MDLFAPDFARLRRVLLRGGEPDRVPFFELFADPEIMEAVLGRKVISVQDRIAYQQKLGYDYVTLWPRNLDFPTEGRASAADTASLPHESRVFNTAGQGAVRTWEDFERYPWPDPALADYAEIETAAACMPEGMKGIVLTGHVLEMPMALMGYEGLSYALFEAPELVKALFDRIGQIYLHVYRDLADMEAVGAVFISDDLAFKTQTMFAPSFLREYVFPWYKRYAEVCHAKDKPVILHSCGNLTEVMGDIISCGIDAKHSFEDQVVPVEEMKRRYGHALAMLGGLDMDLLCRETPEQVRARTREILAACMPGGGYALGTGNSVANYIPVANFLVMLDEGRKMGVYKK